MLSNSGKRGNVKKTKTFERYKAKCEKGAISALEEATRFDVSHNSFIKGAKPANHVTNPQKSCIFL